MGRADRVAVGLLERDQELDVLGGLLDAAVGGRGCVALVEGPAGIGKTCLLAACADAAERRGMVAPSVRGDELVMESSFAGVRELLWQEVGAVRGDAFDGAARWAAPVFEGDPVWGADRDRVSSVLHGLYSLVANLARRHRLALLVDDAQWIDVASARFVLHLARRIGSLPVLVVVAVRTGEKSARAGLRIELAELAEKVLRPGPLSEEASGMVVRDVLGARADEDLCRSCHEATEGNPFYLQELAVALSAERARPTVELARRVRALGTGAIGASVLVRLARLGADCERFAQVLTVLGPGSSLRRVASLAGLDREDASAAADALHAGDLVSVGPELSFVHPIVHEAISAQLPPARRAALHGEAARFLAEDGAAADQVAAHLLLSEAYGETWVVDGMRVAAREALARGAPEAAVSYLRRALAEPPSPDVRLQVLVELGRAEARLPTAHDFTALRTALELAHDPLQRAEIALELGLTLFGVLRNREARAVLEDALRREPELDAEVVRSLDEALIGGGIDDLAASRAVVARAERYFDQFRRGELSDPRMLATLAIIAAFTGRSARDGAALARQALRDERLLSRWLDDGYVTAALGLCWTGQLDQATDAVERGMLEAERRGSAPMRLQLALVRSETGLRAGDLSAAAEYAQRGLELARELDATQVALTCVIPVLLERGRLDEAWELVEHHEIADSSTGMDLLSCRGKVRLALGQCESGVADLLEADERMKAAGLQQTVQVDWVAAVAAALVQLERHEAAQELSMRELAEAVVFGETRRHGIALSVCGTLDHGANGLECLHDAVAILERSCARLEHARALVNLGAGLRARGLTEQAREPLAHALDIADRQDATVIAKRARAELVGAGARPRRASLRGPDALTPAEFRTARLAAVGLSNRQIAQQLVVTPKTVETQLSRAYAKLGSIVVPSSPRRSGATSASSGQPVHVRSELHE
jgi:DNA-binding CsgD family transcriptional regulator